MPCFNTFKYHGFSYYDLILANYVCLKGLQVFPIITDVSPHQAHPYLSHTVDSLPTK